MSPQIFTRLGKCYTFNPGGPGREVLTTLQGGSGNGLELMLNVQQEEYLPVWGDTGETLPAWGDTGDSSRPQVSTRPFGGTQVSTRPSGGTWVTPPALRLNPLPCSADETSFEVGVKVQIHSQDEPPFIDQLGFGVAPGFQTFVSCQQQRVSGHGARGWAQTPEGSERAPGGIGTDPQRAQNGPPKGSARPGVATDIPAGTFQAMGTSRTLPRVPQPSP